MSEAGGAGAASFSTISFTPHYNPGRKHAASGGQGRGKE